MQKLELPFLMSRPFPYMPIHVKTGSYAMSDLSDCISCQDEMPGTTGNLVITKLNENDVLCGRGKGPNNLIGNRRFRAIISDYRAEYLASKVAA